MANNMANNKEKTILVTGATGQQGGAAVGHLQQKGYSVRAATRNPDRPEARRLVGHGTDVVRLDLEDSGTLTRALEGAWGAYSVQNSPNDVDLEVKQGTALADAANRSDVSHFVYSSVASADKQTGIPHFDSKFRIEEHIRGTGLRHSVIRPVAFMDNWLGMRDTIESGTLALPLDPDTKLQMVAVDDIGAFVALAFEHPGKWPGNAIDVAGDELSMTELAEALSRACDREVRYRQVPWDQFEEQAGRELTVMYRWFQNTGFDVDIAAVRREYPKLTSFERWLQTNWRAARAAAQ